LLLLLAACGRPATEAGVKFTGVGMDPGEVQLPGEPKGGVVDLVQLDLAGRNLDLGVTGFFFSTGAFLDPEVDPFSAVLGFSYLFTPALEAAASVELISPVGPSAEDSCMVVVSPNGPLGSFDTVDVGEVMKVWIDPDPDVPDDKGMRLDLARNPQDHNPVRPPTFAFYSGYNGLIQGHSYVPDNWRFGADATFGFDGGIAPEDAPIASIPRPSFAPDARVGRPEKRDVRVYMPERLTNLRSFPRAAAGQSQAAGGLLVFDPDVAGVPGAFSENSNGSMRLTWDPPESGAETRVTIVVKLLGEAPAELGVVDPLDPRNSTTCNDEMDVNVNDYPGGYTDPDYLRDHASMKEWWCDPGYEPIEELEGRRYKIRECVDGLCRDTEGDRGPSGTLGALVCTATDDGDFGIQSEDVDVLLSRVDLASVDGATLTVARTWENDGVRVPGVRDNLGNLSNINPIRVRASHMVVGRLEYDR
jgi:hypothetical protein